MSYLEDSVDLLRKMVAIPSQTFNELEVRQMLEGYLTHKGIDYQIVNNNIIALNKGYDPAKKSLLLCAHIDTVTVATDYGFDPYLPDYQQVAKVLWEKVGQEEVVAGLGSNDDGASVVSMLAAFRHFYAQELPINLILVLEAEEERSGMDGMWAALQALKAQGVEPTWAIVGEPTGMRVAQAEKGLLVLDGEAIGISGHAARNEGVNALYVALDDIEKLRAYSFDRVSPLLGKVKLTVTQINAGTTHNVIPDRCTFVVDIRPTELYSNQEIVDLLQSFCKSTLTPRNLRNRASAARPDSALLSVARSLGKEIYISPTTSDWMRLECDAIKMGPGESERSHHANEYVTVSEIRGGIEGYIEFINNLIIGDN